ncbi:DUF2254 domain-containing protein [Pacificimonas sp. WHA3]|uniref:DUF2254 domain-containing protein n=1 Tax=Pacificimonas pallii TaxID=2827236 RepID=A0ABS6SCI0_9SPHN|nr:DUF2254 domain-containing protein [Pacificimonas pallii]MBV7255557.1 DUF2254 domain-containing protein [Pacificimonas pallii]
MGGSTGDYLVGKWRWLFRQFGQRMWVRATMFSVAAVATALIAVIIGPYLPTTWELKLAAGSVGNILNILASSMLAVTTFSLSIMVSAYGSATSNVTPRATKLLITDSVATNTLATFIGTFLFSIVGIVGLAANIYGNNGRIILFFATLVVIFIVVAALLRWIQELNYFGRVGDTTARVEKRAVAAARNWAQRPRLGANAAVPIPEGAAPIYAHSAGYIQHVDMGTLREACDDCDADIHLVRLPGRFVTPDVPVAYAVPELDSGPRDKVMAAFTIGNERNYDQDPRYGFVVLSEVASRALSPAVNDPGTAIDVLASGTRVFLAYSDGSQEEQTELFERIYAPDVQIEDLMHDFYNAIARDGAGVVEVQIRLQRQLELIARADHALFGEQAKVQAQAAFEHTSAAQLTTPEMAMLRKAADWQPPNRDRSVA